MSHFRLLSPRAAERAATALFASLAATRQLRNLPEAVKNAPQTVEVPGFNLFDQVHGSIQPYKWLITRPSVNIKEFLRAYEKMATWPDRPFESVGLIAGGLFGRASFERAVLSRLRENDQWSQAMLLVLASSLHLGAELEGRTSKGPKLRLGPSLMYIEAGGIWSNTRRSVVPFPEDAHRGESLTTFPPILSGNPTICALVTMLEEEPAISAVNVLAHALAEGHLSRHQLAKWGQLEDPRFKRSLPGEDDPRTEQAINACSSLLTDGAGLNIHALFDAAVPQLMSYKQLQAITGAPSQWTEGRRLRPSTAKIWLERIMAAHLDD